MQLFNSSTLRNVDANSINDGVRIVLKKFFCCCGNPAAKKLLAVDPYSNELNS
jgi:hypothetical protein